MVASQRKYICSFCASAFSRSEHKARHERSHTGSKPFSCSICSHSFVRRDLLQRHIRTVHKSTLTIMQKSSSKNIEEVMNSLIRVSSSTQAATAAQTTKVLPNKPITALVPAATVSTTVSTPVSASMSVPVPATEVYSSKESSVTDAGDSVDDNKIHTAHGSIKSLPMTPSDDDDAGEVGDASCEKNVSSSNGMSLDSDILKTVFSGRFGNILDNPEIMLNMSLSYLHSKSLFTNSLANEWKEAIRDESTFDHWCKNSPLPLALLSVNLLDLNTTDSTGGHDKKQGLIEIWQSCWQKCMKNPYDKSFLPLSILIYVHVHYKENLSHSVLTTSIMYQQILFAMIKSETNPLTQQVEEIWAIFDIFVSLLLKCEEFTEVSTLIFHWFLGQNLYQNFTLAELLDRILSDATDDGSLPTYALLVANQALFCETIMFKCFATHYKSKDTLHNAVILANRLASQRLRKIRQVDHQSHAFDTWKIQVFILHAPPKFVDMINSYCVNPSLPQYWHLLIATWFEFIQDVVPISSDAEHYNWSKFHLNNRWYQCKVKDKNNSTNNNSSTNTSHHILEDLRSSPLIYKNINNNLAICSLPIISSLQHNWSIGDPVVKKLVSDTLLFQLKIFATTLLLNDDASEEAITESMKVFSNPIIHLLLFVWYSSIYHRADGMPKLLYRRGVESDFDNYTMENHAVSQFIKKYIALSRKCVDTDALIENDFKKLLFREKVENAEEFTYFKGYHFLLSRIILSIIRHLQEIGNPSDPDFNFTMKLISELYATISRIQEKVNVHPSNNDGQSTLIRPVSPISTSSPSSLTNTPREDMRRANSVSIGVIHSMEDYQLRDRFNSQSMGTGVQLPPLNLNPSQNHHNHHNHHNKQQQQPQRFEEFAPNNNIINNKFSFDSAVHNNRRNDHIVLPPPMVQNTFMNRERERFTLPPPSAFFKMK